MEQPNDNQRITRRTERNSAIPTCCAGSPDIIVAGYDNGRIKSFETGEGEQLWRIDNAHKSGVTTLKLSRNMRFVVSGGAEGEVRVWEIKTREMISHLKEHIARVNQLDLFTNDQFAITCSRDRCLLTWDLRAERRLTQHREKYGGLNSLAIAQDQTTVYTVGQEKTLTTWDLRHADAKNTADTGEECHSIDIAHNDKYLVTGGDVVKLWDVRALEKPIATCGGHSRPISCVRFSEDDRQVVSRGAEGSQLLFASEIDTGALFPPYFLAEGSVQMFVTQQKALLTELDQFHHTSASSDRSVLIWNVYD